MGKPGAALAAGGDGGGRAGMGRGALARDALAGLVTAVVLVANIVSFAALMFPGPLAQGVPTAIWAMLVGSGLSGLWIAWKSSLPPMATGIDSPAGAVLVLVTASAGGTVFASGGSTAQAVQAALLMLSAATLVTGALFWALGLSRLGSMLRFVPHFVVAGFIGATGWLLVAGGVRLTTGHGLATSPAEWSSAGAARLACAVGVFAALLALRRGMRSALAMPVGLLALTAGGIVALRALGLSGPAQGWYLSSLGALSTWSPLEGLRTTPMPLATALGFLPELAAVAFVALVSMVTKISGLEVSRRAFGDIDVELRAHGIATLAVVPLGGFMGSMQLGTSRLLEDAGGVSRLSGAASALVLLIVGLANFDLPSLIPLPVAAGLVLYLGWGFAVEALARPLRQRDGAMLLLTLAIMAVCVRYGYLWGVLGGIVAACLMFAASYARTGVVRQHLSRVQFAGNVVRSGDASRWLGQHGEAIQLYWLTGYIFFGSSEAVFERVRRDLRARPAGQVRYVVLDFGTVTGLDTSATISLNKLHHLGRQQGVDLVLSSLSPGLRRQLERDGALAAQGPVAPFDAIEPALAWCEDQLLGAATGEDQAAAASPEAGFEAWLQAELGPDVAVGEFLGHLVHRRVDGGTLLYRQGEPADAIDLVAAGRLVIDITGHDRQTLHARRIATHAVVGEMGFFRHTVRSAHVLAEAPATLYTLTRAQYDRLCRERPALAIAFQAFLLRSLSDRLLLTDRLVAAFSQGEVASRAGPGALP